MTRQNRFNPTLSPLSITALPRQTVQAIPVSPVKSLQSPMPTTDPWVSVPSYWSGCLNKSPQWNKAISWGPNAIDLWDRFCCRRWLKLFQQSGLLISISRLLIWLLINGFARITICDLLEKLLILVAPGVIILGIFVLLLRVTVSLGLSIYADEKYLDEKESNITQQTLLWECSWQKRLWPKQS